MTPMFDKKVLILGGTKYLGLKVVELLQEARINFLVASRKEVDGLEVKMIDRKSTQDIENILSYNPDIIIDFINFSAPDTYTLIQALGKRNLSPLLIHISTTYVYSTPQELKKNSKFTEGDFEPLNFIPSDKDWPTINYVLGKRSAEAALVREYPKSRLCILRFPILIGKNDPTNRTQYFRDLVNSGIPFLPEANGGKTSFITVSLAANLILNMVKITHPGVWNLACYDSLSQVELFEVFLNMKSLDGKVKMSGKSQVENSPFYSSFDMYIDVRKAKKEGFPLLNLQDAINMEFSE